MSSSLKCYSVRHELNTLDACWIAVDVWSNSSRCRKYQSTCLGRDALREASSEHYGPQGLLHTIFSALHFFTSLHYPHSDLTLQTILKGLTTPLKRWVQACLFFARTLDLTRPSFWFNTLVPKLREILTAPLLHHPFLFKGKTDANQRSNKKNSYALRKDFCCNTLFLASLTN